MKDIIQNNSIIATYNSRIISKLKKLADNSLNQRSRAIIHLTRNSKVNEMIIVLKKIVIYDLILIQIIKPKLIML